MEHSATSPSENERFLPSKAVQERYATTSMTLWRWSNDPRYAHLGFPSPIKLGSRNYWRLSDLQAWERERAKAA